MDRAEIYCICFNQTSSFLACSSDKGTVHIYSLSANNTNPSHNSATTNATAASGKFRSESFHDASTNTTSITANNSTASEHESLQSSTNKQMGGLGITFLKGILPVSMVPRYFDSEWSFAQVIVFCCE